MPLLCRTSLVVLCSSMVVCFRARTSPWSILLMSWISLWSHLSHSGTSSRLQHPTHLSVNELFVFWTTSWWTWRGPLSYQKVYQDRVSTSKDLRSAPSNVHVSICPADMWSLPQAQSILMPVLPSQVSLMQYSVLCTLHLLCPQTGMRYGDSQML